MCNCVHAWTEDKKLDPELTNRMIPVTCAEYIAALEELVSSLAYQMGAELLATASADNFTWQATTKRLVDLKERVHNKE